MIVLSETVKTFAGLKDISDKDFRLLSQYLFGEDVTLPPTLQIYARIAIEDKERIEAAARKKYEAKKEAHTAYMRVWREQKSTRPCDSCDSSQDSQSDCERCDRSNAACDHGDRVPSIPHQTIPSKPSHPKDCSCRSSPVQSAPARMRTLGELVSEDEIIKFSLPLRHPDEDADWYEGTLREHYQMVSDTPVRSTWQTLWRAAINDLRKNGAFVVPVGIDSSSDSFA